MSHIKAISGVDIPRLIYGTAWKKEQTTELVLLAIKTGFRGVDTACQPKHYREDLVGEAVRAAIANGMVSREDLFVQTKFTPVRGQDLKNIPYDPQASLTDQVNQSWSATERNLGLEYVDSLILHSPLSNHGDLMQVWRAMEQVHDRGAVRQLGISNTYDVEVLKKLWQDARVKPAVVQNRFYADTGYDTELRAWCVQNGVVYQSFWTLTANPRILNSRAVKQIAENHAVEPAQVLFRALIQVGCAPLTGTTSKKHMVEDLRVLSLQLTDAEVQEVMAQL